MFGGQSVKIKKLDDIASRYHVGESVPDKFIEDISQYYFCDWLKSEFSPSLRVCEMGFGEGITASKMSAHFLTTPL